VNVAGKAPWVISTSEHPPALEIVLLKQTLILSWNQFVYAEGGSDELLAAIASHRVASIRESVRSERFPGPAARLIREIVIRKINVD
jgi:hypothetical protein